jgi:hypothetical protein
MWEAKLGLVIPDFNVQPDLEQREYLNKEKAELLPRVMFSLTLDIENS